MIQTLSSPYGPIELWPCSSPDALERFEIDSSLNVFRPAALQQQALVGIAADTDGCILVGLKPTRNGVSSSKLAFARLSKLIKSRAKKEKIFLIIS